MNAETKRKLRLMNIGEFIDAVEMQSDDPATMDLPFEERFQQLVDTVYQEKYDTRVIKLIKSAKLRLPQADIHDVYYHEKRAVDRRVVNELATCRFVDTHRSVILQGYPSSGKTYLACAIGKEACRKNYTTRYIRVSDLLNLAAERSLIPGGRNKLLTKYSNYKVLILDEWLTANDISTEELNFLFELFERRYDTTSTIFCTLCKPEEWVRNLGGGKYAESIYERYRYNSIQVETGRMNMRELFAQRD